jgi:thiol:disulfide interchange protein
MTLTSLSSAVKRLPLVASLLILPSMAFAGIDWNDKQVKWHSYDAGVAAAQRENKPILLVVYADWCGVCKKYSTMFTDPAVIKGSKKVVLIRLNQDTDGKYLAKYSLDGKYVPRTFIMNKNQVIQPSPYKSDNYAFFLPPESNAFLVELFDQMKP